MKREKEVEENGGRTEKLQRWICSAVHIWKKEIISENILSGYDILGVVRFYCSAVLETSLGAWTAYLKQNFIRILSD